MSNKQTPGMAVLNLVADALSQEAIEMASIHGKESKERGKIAVIALRIHDKLKEQYGIDIARKFLLRYREKQD